MTEYTRTVMVDATASHVFAFISKIDNLPKYLPTVNKAKSQGADRVEVDGSANGHAYHNDGYFKVDKDARTMTWGSDGEHDYSGKLEVHAAGEDASKVSCTLQFGAGGASTMPGRESAINEGLEASLNSIKNECEGVGGKQPTSADR